MKIQPITPTAKKPDRRQFWGWDRATEDLTVFISSAGKGVFRTKKVKEWRISAENSSAPILELRANGRLLDETC